MKKGIECTGCASGVKMCHNRPCLGTPEEFEAIIDAGYAEKLRLDYWAGAPLGSRMTQEDIDNEDGAFKELARLVYEYQQKSPNPFTKDVEWLSGGTMTDVNFKTRFSPTGTCHFLTPDEKCELHALGLKPEQGRTSCCNSEKDTSANSNIEYAYLWDTPKGKEVVEKFKKIVGI